MNFNLVVDQADKNIGLHDRAVDTAVHRLRAVVVVTSRPKLFSDEVNRPLFLVKLFPGYNLGLSCDSFGLKFGLP